MTSNPPSITFNNHAYSHSHGPEKNQSPSDDSIWETGIDHLRIQVSKSITSLSESFLNQIPKENIIRYTNHSVAFNIPNGKNSDYKSMFYISVKKSTSELTLDINTKLLNANNRRYALLQEKVYALKRRSANIKYQILLKEHRLRLTSLKIEARLEYALTAASLRRHIIQRKITERLSSHSDHVSHISLSMKFKNLLKLRKELSDSLAETAQLMIGDGMMMDEYMSENVTEYNYGSESPASSVGKPLPQLNRKHQPVSLDSYVNTPKADSIKEIQLLLVKDFQDVDEYEYLEFLPLLPPVTRFTLRELDMAEIVMNAQLRHTLYFDANLKFKPRIEALKGADKMEALDKVKNYWSELQLELDNGIYYRVPLLLFEAKQILKEVLSDLEEVKIGEWIDLNITEQEIQHNIFNPSETISPLAAIMKKHCSPSRDELVDKMTAACQIGDFCETFKIMYQVLELMKLDYANYNLERIRPLILERAVEFEWRWFKDRLDLDIFSIQETTAWLDKSKEIPAKSTNDRFTKATLELIRSIHLLPSEKIPETFHLDHVALISMNSDFQDIVILSVIMLLFKQLSGPKLTMKYLQQSKEDIWVLLNDSDTTMDHVILELINRAEEIRGCKLIGAEKIQFQALVQKSLNPNDAINKLLQTKIQQQLYKQIINKELNEDELIQQGISYVSSEIITLGNEIHELLEFHWKVYFNLYNTILTTSHSENE